MKFFLSILYTFLTFALFANTNFKTNVSPGTFLDSSVIYDEDTEDVFGYLLLYVLDEKDENLYELEYVFLDNNLNKISSMTKINQHFSHKYAKYSKYTTKLSLVKKVGNEIFVGTSQKNLYGIINLSVNSSYFTFNITSLKFSDTFNFMNNEKMDYSLKENLRENLKSDYSNLNFRQEIHGTKGSYFVKFNPEENKKSNTLKFATSFSSFVSRKYDGFSVLDMNFNEVWTLKYIENVKNSYVKYEILTTSKDRLVMLKKHYTKKVTETLEVFNLIDGTHLSSIPYTNDLYYLKLATIEDNGDNFDIINVLFKPNDYIALNKDIQGYSKLSINKKTGQKVSHDYLTWVDLRDKFNFEKPEKSGKISKYGHLLLRDFVSLKSGKHIGVFEAVEIKYLSDLYKDIYFIEFDSNLKVLNIVKNENISEYRSYRYSQKLNNNDDFVFFYNKTKEENHEYVSNLVITKFQNNKFLNEELPLKKGNSKIYPSLAKNGYFLLLEYDNENNLIERRLEKINL